MTEKPRIEPRTLKGFRDYLPEAMIPRERLIDTARRVYRSYGFSPIDTPALEYLEILAGKGGEETDKQLYKFQDHGERWVGLRFDLTVPLARFAAQHVNELGTPFKRYHIATVWRGENTQRGRYREFMQCDFDTIGTRSIAADIETALVIHDLFRAIGFGDFTIRVNNRMVLTGLLGAARPGRRVDRRALRAGQARQDRPGDGGRGDGRRGRARRRSKPGEVLRLSEITGSERRRAAAGRAAGGRQRDGRGGRGEAHARCSTALAAAGVPSARVQLDVSIARGLDYYTGTIFETFLDALPGIGSICSGGRYDNLAELFTTQELPGIGASLGLDRLLAAMEELGMIEKVSTPAPVFIPYFDKDRLHDYLRLAAALRAAGIGVEVFPEAKKLGQQLKYADRRGFRVALIAGSNEFDADVCQVKDLQTGDKHDVPLAGDYAELIAEVRKLI